MGGALRLHQEHVDCRETAGRGGFSAVRRGGPESGARVVRRGAELLAGVSLGVGRGVAAGQGVARVHADEEHGCIIGNGPAGRAGRKPEARWDDVRHSLARARRVGVSGFSHVVQPSVAGGPCAAIFHIESPRTARGRRRVLLCPSVLVVL